MRYFVILTLALCTFVSVTAQPFFDVVSPNWGQAVRETFAVKISRSVIKPDQYVAFWANGHFLLATEPVIKDGYNIYYIDTKANKIPDGRLRLEIVLYSERPQSSKPLTKVIRLLNVKNHSSIHVPPHGFLLRYRFKPSQQLVYHVREYARPEGSKAVEMLPTGQYRLLLTTENVLHAHHDLEAVIRTQVLNMPGKEDFKLTDFVGTKLSSRFIPADVIPFDAIITTRGKEVYGSVPPVVDLTIKGNTVSSRNEKSKSVIAGTSTAKKVRYLQVGFHLPILPEGHLSPKGTVKSALLGHLGKPGFILESFDRVPIPIPATVTFEDVEWESGRRCARLSYQPAQTPSNTSANVHNLLPTNWKDTYWFDLDRKVILRIERIQTAAVLAPQAAATTTKAVPMKQGMKASAAKGQIGGAPGVTKRGPKPGGVARAGTAESGQEEQQAVPVVNKVIYHAIVTLQSTL